jgi:hypothetical protein
MFLVNRTRFIIQQIGNLEKILKYILSLDDEKLIIEALRIFPFKDCITCILPWDDSVPNFEWAFDLYFQFMDGTTKHFKEKLGGLDKTRLWKLAATFIINREIEKQQRRLWFQR